MAHWVKGETARRITQQYLESHDAVRTANALGDLVRRANEGRLPAARETVERQVCALAIADCTAEGGDFVDAARSILGDPDRCNHPLVDYQIAAMRDDRDKMERLDVALAGGRYGEWAAERLAEMKRYMGLEPPRFTIRYGERIPQWETLWRKILTGGDET